MPRSAILSLLFVGCLVLVAPVVAQPLGLTSHNGCDVFVTLDGGLEFQPFGHVGSLIMQKTGSDERVKFDFECVDFPMEPEAEPEGIQQSRSLCNWRMRENGVKGTTRAEVRWFPVPEFPGQQLTFSVNAQIIRGTRYPTGVTSAQGSVDLNAGTIELDAFTAVLCYPLGP